MQSHGTPTGEGYFRHALFRPVQKTTEEASKGLRMHGHTDFGTTTQLFSVPISCLQIWGRDEEWHYVPYKPGALVINIGETLEIVSGGHFKATRHRVYKPPADQAHEERLSLVLFNSSVGDLRMAPVACEPTLDRPREIPTLTLSASPLIQREGCIEEQGVYKEFRRLMDAGVPVPTNKQWREIQVSKITRCHLSESHHPDSCRSPKPPTPRTLCVTGSAPTRSFSGANSCSNASTLVSRYSFLFRWGSHFSPWVLYILYLLV